MTLWIFDTDHTTLFQQGNPQIVQRVSAVNPKDIAITLVTFEEQMYGRLNRIRRATSGDEVISAYASLRKTINYLTDFELLDFDRDAENYYREFLRQKIRVGTQDLRIGAIALSNSGVLLTRNRRDFERIPGLRFEDWSV
ncbi:MAG: type II toxin-antitoxin system VapC family toxin [Microcoleus sp. PH2017_25_DOB_D_A]|uniref:type II toxin-antitoxin system VapC family toxin n=1 Tax=unclassified Microcoleus TaxID=2642155 RepID=UPI001DCE9383|nr:MULTISPECIES: type II toxin-antitoxin system VapC family toxin [unclassified Microcoleus]MCC3469699.1 type II toxin-antitoxin system VapC family toxin [Microcoleus sp. PH2017_06_SFM_O_A]TAE11991.1 MAG: type II toxin-antitoxin system VapC family toxin [Oscillatoriales cyanobacterium]MCC3491533.1 type II toxin-antitoxin system VapC family toxin [Microcoleus sp. PH2017_16_JOR_D_A]MCC3535108.1 type II toxin-antitoxin system VapC family toxin [Microcoleus sp. PH2017_25_DOB_D_A]MCC3547342.1 type 